MSQPALERGIPGATAARGLLREGPAVRRVRRRYAQRPGSQSPQRSCFRRVRRNHTGVERSQLASQGEVRTEVITGSNRALKLTECDYPQVRRFQLGDEWPAATHDNQHVVAPALQRFCQVLYVQARTADDVAARDDDRDAHTDAAVGHKRASCNGVYAGPHTRDASAAARAGTRLSVSSITFVRSLNRRFGANRI